MKAAIFHPKVLEVLQTFPKIVRRAFGKAIFELQNGVILLMPLCRPMPQIAVGVEELRVRDAQGVYRVFYFKKSLRGILIFHAFVKKTQKTLRREIDLGRRRLEELFDEEV